LTNTCAANALGVTVYGDYAEGDSAAATAAFDIAGRFLRLPGEEVAKRMITATTDLLGDLVTAVARQHQLTQPKLVAVGGGRCGWWPPGRWRWPRASCPAGRRSARRRRPRWPFRPASRLPDRSAPTGCPATLAGNGYCSSTGSATPSSTPRGRRRRSRPTGRRERPSSDGWQRHLCSCWVCSSDRSTYVSTG